jgi:CRP-like cAMP-binding protein
MAMSHPDLLAGLAADDAARVMALASPVALAPGQVLFHLGADATSLFLVERGRVALTLPMQILGREEDVLVEERSPGQALGWSALIPPHRFTLKAKAEVETVVLAFPRETLLAHFADRPAIGYVVTRNVASVVGQRLQVFQAMWLREMQRMVELRSA